MKETRFLYRHFIGGVCVCVRARVSISIIHGNMKHPLFLRRGISICIVRAFFSPLMFAISATRRHNQHLMPHSLSLSVYVLQLLFFCASSLFTLQLYTENAMEKEEKNKQHCISHQRNNLCVFNFLLCVRVCTPTHTHKNQVRILHSANSM